MERCPGCHRQQYRLDTDGFGRVIEVPTPCRCAYWRRVNGVCRYCHRPVTGKKKVAIYCDHHRIEARRAVVKRHLAKVGTKHQRRYYERHAEEIRARARLRYQLDPAERERRNAYKREWRQRNRDKVRLQKRRAALRSRAAAEYHRRYREELAAGLRTPKPAPRNERGERLCLTPGCRSVLTGRAKKCWACKAGHARLF